MKRKFAFLQLLFNTCTNTIVCDVFNSRFSVALEKSLGFLDVHTAYHEFRNYHESPHMAGYYTVCYIFNIGISDAVALPDLRVLQVFLPLSQNSLSNTYLSSKIYDLRTHGLLVVPVMQRRRHVVHIRNETT